MKLFRQILIMLGFSLSSEKESDFYDHRVFETCEDFELISR